MDNGAAGPNWSRTGASLKIFSDLAHAPMNAMPVCRFYGTIGLGSNSHFFTVDPAECAQVNLDPGWTCEKNCLLLDQAVFRSCLRCLPPALWQDIHLFAHHSHMACVQPAGGIQR
jgi:hypothetical protein